MRFQKISFNGAMSQKLEEVIHCSVQLHEVNRWVAGQQLEWSDEESLVLKSQKLHQAPS